MKSVYQDDGGRFMAEAEHARQGKYCMDPQGHLLAVDLAVARIFGYETAEAMLGSPHAHIETLMDARARKKFLRTLKKQGCVTGLEARARRKDGNVLWICWNARLAQPKSGEGPYYEGELTDITIHKGLDFATLAGEETYRLLVDHLPAVVFLDAADELETTLYISPKVEAMLGYTPEEWKATPNLWEASLHPADRQRVLAEDKRTREAGEAFQVEYRLKRKDGVYVWVREESSPIKDANGTTVFWQGFLLDISAQKEAEETVRRSEALFTQVFYANPVACCITTLEEGIFVDANQAYWDLSGFRPEETIGRRAVELGFLLQEQRQDFLTHLRRQKSLKGVEGRFLTKEGKILHTLEFYEIISLWGKDHLLSMFYDLTGRMIALRALQESEERYRSLVEASPEPILVLLDGKIVFANPITMQMMGAESAEQVVGHSISRFVHPDYRELAARRAQRTLDNGKPLPLAEEKWLRLDGTAMDVEVVSLPIQYNGRPAIQILVRDITERKRAEAALRQSEASYRGLFDSLQEAIYIQARDGRFLDVNEGAVRMYGYPREFFIGKTPEAISAPGLNDLEAVRLALARAFEGHPQQFEFWGRRSNGEVFPKEVRLYRGAYFGQEVVFALADDITERRHTEEAMLTTTAMLQRQVEELTILQQVAIAASTASSIDLLLERVIDIISGSFYPDTCGVALTSEDKQEIFIHPASRGVKHYIGVSKPISMGVIGEVVRSRRAIRLGDVKQAEAYIEAMPGIQSELCVPIRKGDEVIGVINVESKKANAFDEADERLLDTVAGNLATAIERLRLLESEQKRRQEAELLHEATAALTSTLDLQALYDVILENLAKIVPYDSASITLIDADDLLIVAGRGLPAEYDWIGKRFRGSERWNEIFASHQPLVMPDAQADARFEPWEGTEYIRGWMGVPLISQGRIMGLLNVDSRRIDAFGAREALLAQTFAHSAAVAIENARQFDAEQRHRREAESLRITAEAISSSLDIRDVLHAVLDNLSVVVPYDSATVFLLEGKRVRLMAAKGLPNLEEAISKVFPAEEPLLQEIWASKQPLILQDAQVDERFEGWAETKYVRGWMGIPLLSHEELIGCLTVDSRRPGVYTQHEAALAMAFAHQAAVAIENARLYERSKKQVRQLTALRDIDTAISASFDLKVTLNILLAHTLQELEVDAAIIWLYLPALHSLSYHTSLGFANKYAFPKMPVRLEQSLAGQAVFQRDLIHVTDLPYRLHEVCWPVAEEKFQTYFGIPLINKGQIHGVLEIYARAPLAPDTDWLTYLRTLAGQAAIAIDNAQLFKNLQRSNQELMLAYDTTLEGWSKALELRDKETEGHTRRVTAMTLELARRLGIEGEQLTHILRGSLLHDIGKMGIPDSILNKPASLTPEEWEIMRQHPQYAYDLLSSIPYLRPALDIPYCHHERWDGSGYPRGLKGEEIPLAARIFAVVDIWDALLYDRPYRQAWAPEQVTSYLRSKAGTELDPEIVEVFLQLLSEKKE